MALSEKFRDPVSGLMHLGGSIAALVGLIVLLVVGKGDGYRLGSLLVYGISLVLLFAASATYHLTIADAKVIRVLRKFDHSAIYLLIAGTYTPICINAFTGFWRWNFLAIIWGLALIGIAVKIFVINAPRWVTAGIYIVMGWLCLAAIGEMLAVLSPASLIFLVAGGVIYTLGAVVYISRKMDFLPGVFGFHEVWHIFVLLGAAAHFVAILLMILDISG